MKRLFLFLLPCLRVAALVQASTYVVKPDGTGDYPTIQTALDACRSGDVITLTDGRFQGAGNRDLDYRGKSLTLRSLSGNPSACVIDCGGSATEPHRGIHFQSAEGRTAVLQGVTITGGNLSGENVLENGGAVCCDGSAAPTLQNCVFSSNLAVTGAAVAGLGSSAPLLTDCTFSDNVALGLPGGGVGGGVGCRDHASVELVRCEFFNNQAYFGGALYCNDSGSLRVDSCVLARNLAPLGGGICCQGGVCSVYHSTLVANITVWQGGGMFGAMGVVENTIVAFSTGDAVQGTGTFSCCDLYGNSGGDSIGSIANQYGVNGNISADPLFCDAANSDYYIFDISPCAPANAPSGCGLIGALGAGCQSGVARSERAPATLILAGGIPNPAGSSSLILYGIPPGSGGSRVSLRVFDAGGRLVRTLVEQDEAPGYHQVRWDGADETGRPVASGLYYCRLVSGGMRQWRSLVLLRNR